MFAVLMLFNFLNRIKPSDFDYLKIIGKGSFGKVGTNSFHAVKMSILMSYFQVRMLTASYVTGSARKAQGK